MMPFWRLLELSAQLSLLPPLGTAGRATGQLRMGQPAVPPAMPGLSALNTSRFLFSSAPVGPAPWEQPWGLARAREAPGTWALQSRRGPPRPRRPPQQTGPEQTFSLLCHPKSSCLPSPQGQAGRRRRRRREGDSSRAPRWRCACRHPARLCPARRHLRNPGDSPGGAGVPGPLPGLLWRPQTAGGLSLHP